MCKRVEDTGRERPTPRLVCGVRMRTHVPGARGMEGGAGSRHQRHIPELLSNTVIKLAS